MSRTQRLAQPQEFGKYQLVARLAHGRMGDVYKAKSHGVEGFEKILVVKVIHPAFSAIPNFVDTIVEEAKKAVALSHANVAQVYDIGLEETGQQFYLAMEYVNGMDLARAMTLSRQNSRTWPQELAVFIASEIAKGLDYAHRRKDFNFQNLNIIHRGLTTQNVILAYEGEVKLTDFGISRAMELTTPIDNEEAIHRYLHLAPEAARGEAHTRQSDIFSLGLILYEMLAGKHPYFDVDPNQVLERARRAEIPPISTLSNIPRPLTQILESMLVHDPAGRAPSAGQIYEELIGYLFGNNLKADNRTLALTMGELRRRDQGSTREATLEVGLEEISLHELEASYEKSEGFYLDPDVTGTAEISESTKSALPSARMARLLQDQPSFPDKGASAKQGLDNPPPLPGALEDYFRSAGAGRGKAILVSGRLGRGRQYLPDRLVETLAWRGNTTAISIQTTADDRYRPFGVLSDLILKNVNHTVAETLDHRQGALQLLTQLKVSPEAVETLSGFWGLTPDHRASYTLHKNHLSQIFMAILRDLSHRDPLVIVIDQVERIDALSLDVLRHVVAEIGSLSLMLVLGTGLDETMRAVFDTGQPEDLEALRINAEEPPGPTQIAELGARASTLVTLLTLSEQALSQPDLAELTGLDQIELLASLRELAEIGAIRVPRPGTFIGGTPQWLSWFEDQGGLNEIEHLASSLGRFYAHRVKRDEIDRLTPTLVRLYALGGDRRKMLSFAQSYGHWLEQKGWYKSALEFYKHCASLLARPTLGTPQTRIDYLVTAAELALELALIDECRTILEPLGALSETVRNDQGMIRAQLLLGQMALQQDDLEDARTYFQRGAEAAQAIQDPDLLARSLLCLASWHERHGDSVMASMKFEGAMNLYSRWGTRRMDLTLRAVLLLRAVRMWTARGMMTRARRPLDDLRSLSQTSHLNAVSCRANWAEARYHAGVKKYDEALKFISQALQDAEGQGLMALRIELAREKATIALEAGDYQSAGDVASALIELAAHHKDYYSEQRARDILATASCMLRRDVEPSLTHLQQSLRRATERRVPKDVYRCHELLELTLRALGRVAEAEKHLAQAEEIARSMRFVPAA